MKKIYGLLAVIGLLSLIPPYSFSTTIHIPNDQLTIQAGIDVSLDGDTILVSDGQYYERINFTGKEILLASNYIIDQSESHIQNTIIDGDISVLGEADTGCVVIFVNEEELNSVLKGFTIQNGIGLNLGGTQGRRGGGIFCYGSSPTISHCIISNNEGWDGGGGIYCTQYSSPRIESCTIVDNFTHYHGGGLAIWHYCMVDLYDCTFIGNIANNCGGGIYCAFSQPKINNCFFYENSAPRQYGGAMEIAWQSDAEVSDCILFRNSALGGGGIWCHSGNLIISNSTIVENSASGEDGGGAIAFDMVGNMLIENSILWANYPNEIEIIAGDSPIINCSDIFSGWPGGNDNISSDPFFCGLGGKDFHISAYSPCLPENNNCGVLMGASEEGCEYICGDANGDIGINILDIVFLLNCKYKNGPCPAILESVDVNNDSALNILDIVYLIEYLYKNGSYPACP